MADGLGHQRDVLGVVRGAAGPRVSVQQYVKDASQRVQGESGGRLSVREVI